MSGIVSTTKPVLVSLLLFAENFVFLARDRMETTLFRAFLFGAVFLADFFGVACLEAALFRATFLFGFVFVADFFRVVCFFLFGMRAVYHSTPFIIMMKI